MSKMEWNPENPIVLNPSAHLLLWLISGVQILGLVSTVLARCSEGSRGQNPCQWLFLACLALVGMATLITVGLHWESWIFCAATLAVMVLFSVWELGKPAHTELA